MKLKTDARGKHLSMRFGVNSNHWKGEEAGYYAKHAWIRKHFGKADHCERCNKPTKRYEWANISGTHKRERSDYLQLCVSCHRRMDWREETRAKLILAKRGIPRKGRPIIQLDLNNNIIKEYGSTKEAVAETGILNTAISNCLSGRSRKAGKYKWKRK